MKKLLISVIVIFVIGCTAPIDTKIDASSKESAKKSIATIKSKLKKDEADKLDESLKVIAFSEINTEGGLLGMMAQLQNPEAILEGALSKIDGKSPNEIISLANEIQRDRWKKQLNSVTQEISDLIAKRNDYESAMEFLEKIIIKSPKFYSSKVGFLQQPVIDFTIANNTNRALARIYFHGTVTSLGREIPWISEDFNYKFPGGLEKGETKQLSLSPNMYSSWGNNEASKRKDTVLVVDVLNAEDASGKTITEQFKKTDKERLEELKKQEADLKGKLSQVS